jgi:hypothetical protein
MSELSVDVASRGSFLDELRSAIDEAPITEEMAIVDPMPDTGPTYTARRLWLPTKGDVFDSKEVDAVLDKYAQFAKPPVDRFLSVVPRWQLRILLADQIGHRPTKQRVSSAIGGLPDSLRVKTDRVDVLRGFHGYFTAFVLDPATNELAAKDNIRILRGLEAHELVDGEQHHYLGHLSVFHTDSRKMAETLKRRLTEAASLPSELLFDKVELARTTLKFV